MTIRLKRDRDHSLKRWHPWIFSGAVQKVEGDPASGDTVEVISSDGKWLARAAYSPSSQIIARAWTFREDEEVDAAFLRERLERSVRRRNLPPELPADLALRLCYAESDQLPGLVIDCYGNWLVTQFLSAGAEKWRPQVLQMLREMFPAHNILDRSEQEVRLKEGLPLRVEVVQGTVPEVGVVIQEGPARFSVDLLKGHKTGYYLDQKDNRALFMNYCQGKKVLNAFSYTGGFGVFARLAGAAEVINIDTSAEVLEMARKNYALNGIDPGEGEFMPADVFTALRRFRDQAADFDVIVLDPPKFVASASQMKGGTRGYKDINLLAMKLLRPGGVLFTFSCSGLVTPELFGKIVSDAAIDARREVQLIHHLFQSDDHPVSIHFPEGLYLKGLACRVW